MLATLRKNILATLTYYDVLNYPLTSFEVRKYLLHYHTEASADKARLDSILEKLSELRQEGAVEERNGFWFLPGRNALVGERIAKEKISAAKLKRMRKLVGLLRYLPFVRLVAATGSLSLRHGSKESDWDMFIVLERGALFTGRAVLTFFLHLIGKRRHGKKIVDRACLNYFAASDNLAVRLQDWYAAHEYQVMIPLFQTLAPDAFYRANSWLLDFRRQAHLPVTSHRLSLSDRPLAQRSRKIWEGLLKSRKLEAFLAKLQKKKIMGNPRTAWEGACIIADHQALVFFPAPRGPKIFAEFQKRLRF